MSALLEYKSSTKMVTDMINYAVAAGAPITDYNEGATLRTFFEAVSWIVTGAMGKARSEWETALSQFIYIAFQFTKKTGTVASTTLQFDSDDVVLIDTIIPIGSQVRSSDGIIFETITEGLITTGSSLSNSVSATSIEKGADKNVSADSVTILISNIVGVKAVSNVVAALGGTDSESEAALQQRFSLFVSNLAKSTLLGLKTGALTVEGVKYADVVEQLGNYSTVSLTFGTNIAPEEDLIIPSGLRVKNTSGIIFITTSIGTISAGQLTSNAVAARSINRGTETNVLASTITSFVDNVTGVDSVTNPAAASGATDGVLGIINLYVDDGSGSVTTDVLNEVIKVIEGDPNDRENYPGYRAAGTVIRYGTPIIVSVDIMQTVYVDIGTIADDIKQAVADKQSEYLNSLRIGKDVVVQELVASALSVEGVKDIQVGEPASNIVIPTTSIAKPGLFDTTVVGFVDHD